MSKEVTLTDQNFENEVVKSDKPVLVDFWAPWCGPCRMIAPVLSELAEERAETLKIAKYNVDEQRDYAMKFGIQSIPTMILFKDGKVIDQLIGAMPKQMLISAIDKKLA